MVHSFSPRQPMHKRRLPSAFLAKRTGALAVEEEERVNPLDRLSSIHASRVSSSTWLSEYIGPNGGVKPSLSGIEWPYGRCGGSSRAVTSPREGGNHGIRRGRCPSG